MDMCISDDRVLVVTYVTVYIHRVIQANLYNDNVAINIVENISSSSSSVTAYSSAVDLGGG